MNGCFGEIKGNKYLTLVPATERKEKKYEELWNKIRDLIRSVTENSDDRVHTVWKVREESICFKRGQGKSGKLREIERFYIKSQGKSGKSFQENVIIKFPETHLVKQIWSNTNNLS